MFLVAVLGAALAGRYLGVWPALGMGFVLAVARLVLSVLAEERAPAAWYPPPPPPIQWPDTHGRRHA